MCSVSISISSYSATNSTMSSPNGVWAEPEMLDIIRRAVQNQAMTDTDRQQLEEFLDIPSQSRVARSRPPSYTEEPPQGHGTFPTIPPLQQQWSDTGTSLRRTSTHGTNQNGSSGLGDRGQQSDTGSPQASLSGSTHRRQQSSTRSPQANPSASASSSGSPHQGRSRTNTGVGPGQPGAEGDFHDLVVPDPRRAGDRSHGGQRGESEGQDT